jgi:methylmalonyl-CoA mutase
MPDKSFDKVLENFFSKSDKSDWKKIAMQETHGKDPFEILSWRGKDEILFLPYYDPQDVANLHLLNGFQIPAAENTSSEKRSWLNLPAVKASDVVKANALALSHLAFGAPGVLFDLRNLHHIDFNQLMQNILWPHCQVAFQVNPAQPVADPLSQFIKSKFQPASISGALFWESIPKKSNFDFYFDDCKNFKALGLIIRPSRPTIEISDALLEGVKVYETFSGSDAESVFKSISFSLTTDAAFVESGAKLKALRMLWFQVARSYGHNDYNIQDLFIHARTQQAGEGVYAPHENMLAGTFAAIAAIVGGCDSITITCEDEPPLVPRWAGNVSNILREESFFDQVADPLAGSYALDSIVHSLASKAWEIFQVKLQRL